MKSKTKVSYVSEYYLENLPDSVNKELSAINVNVRNVIKDVSLNYVPNAGYVVQIVYEELDINNEDELKTVLNG